MDLNINLFNFTASIDDEVTTPSKARQKGRKKKPRNEQQDDAPGESDSLLNKAAGSCYALRGPTATAVKDSADPDQSAREKIQKVQSSSSIVDDVAQQTSPLRAGSLKEKILRLVPNQQYACKEKPAGSHSVAILSLEPPTKGENNSEDERGRRERQGDSRGGNEPDSKRYAGAICVGTEVLSPEISGESCTQVSEAQNSKYDLHCDSLLKQIFKVFFFLNLH